jgi:hypothetical protein
MGPASVTGLYHRRSNRRCKPADAPS